MKSFGLLKTNVILTSNIKLIIDSNQNLFLESIESDPFLSLDRLKKFKYNNNLSYGKNISLFFNKIPNDIIFKIKKTSLSLMSNKYSNQNDNLYEYGAKSILNNKDYDEKFEYFAPLYINQKVPSNFIIFRIDGAVYDDINKNDFLNKTVNNFKVVKVFDLNKNNIKAFFDKSFLKNNSFPPIPLDINFRENEFSYWYGIDLKSGVYTNKSFLLSNYMKNEKEIYELERFVTNKYKDLDLIYPNIINFTFLFDDTYSTPDEKKEWTVNRYFGFYADELILEDTVTTYVSPKLKNDVVIEKGNMLRSISENYPFLEKWDETTPFYIEYLGLFYLVQKKTVRNVIDLQKTNKEDHLKEEYSYRTDDIYYIISDIDLTNKQNYLNKKTIKIDSDGFLLNLDYSPYLLDKSSADVWLIEIDNTYYSLKTEGNKTKINSDSAFEFNQNYYRIKNSGNWKKFDIKINFDKKPLSFNIFKVKLSDIKYFDNRIIDTDSSRFEYEKENELTDTQEPKLYVEDFNDNSFPRKIESFILNKKEVFIPTSSEYTANMETFKINEGMLSDIWQPNSNYCRWGYLNSLSTYDYPYTLNNSFLLEEYNRSISLDKSIPLRSDRNLDYFYSLTNDKTSYVFNSLEISKPRFEINNYINSETDYFSDFFEDDEILNTEKKKYKKYSLVNKNINRNSNHTLFRGIKFNFYKFLKYSNNKVEDTNVFENYKFSIILDKKKESEIEWAILKEWQLNQNYIKDDLVVFNDIIYVCINDNIQINPTIQINSVELKASPYNLTNNWQPYNLKTILWTPSNSVTYQRDDLVFNNNNYYICSLETGIDFWNPYQQYTKGSIVIYKGSLYKSTLDNNFYSPDQGLEKTINNRFDNIGKYWETIDSTDINMKWKEVPIWSSENRYNIDSFVYYEGSVYKSLNGIDINQSPENTNLWVKIYSLNCDNQTIYLPNKNPIIIHNNHYYLVVSNQNNEYMDNGIEVYINKKWKNILIMLNVSDNTLPNIANTQRDQIYDMLYQKLTAFNFISSINNINLKNGWSNNLKYHIIDEDSNIKIYDHREINELPYIIQCSFPDEINMNPHPIEKVAEKLLPKISIKNSIPSNIINNLKQAHLFSNLPLSYQINDPVENTQDLNTFVLFRYSGPYAPIFLNVELFKNNNLKFNIDLSDFGIIKEKKIIKVNSNDSVLNLRNSKDFISIYPMIDEFGITTVDWDIFKSTYSKNYIYSVAKKNQ